MRKSLALRLIFAFLLVSVTGVVLTALLARWATYQEFEQLVLERAREDYVAQATTYYEEHSSWVGVAQVLHRRTQLPAPGPPSAGQRSEPLSFVLVDRLGVVVASGGPFRLGTQIPQALIAEGIPIEINGTVVGTVVTTGEPPELDQQEQTYLARTNRVSLYAALGATLIALILGILLARTLTRPIRALTRATQSVAAGYLEQKVIVHTQDELGELASAFNQMSSDLAQATAARRQMTADIAHDLRTPLTIISGYLESMRDGVLQPTPARFETMYAEAQHLLRLVEDLRTLSLADAGKLTLNKTTVPPHALLDRLADVYQLPAEKNGIILLVDTPGYLPDIIVDPDRMLQVMGNLVSNALRYTPEGGRITLCAAARKNAITLTVTDNGAGIPPEALPYVFDRFYRVDESRTQDEPSAVHETESGLGLAIAKSITEAHGGTITVASEVGQGTTFTITLPV